MIYIFFLSASGAGGKLAEQRTEVLTFAIIRMVYPKTTKFLVVLGLSECQFDHRVIARTIVIMAKESLGTAKSPEGPKVLREIL